MEKIEDYNALAQLEKIEGREILVLYSRLIYQIIDGKWEVVGKVNSKGKPTYIR